MNLQGPFGEDPRNLPDVGYYSAWYQIDENMGTTRGTSFQVADPTWTASADLGLPYDFTLRAVNGAMRVPGGRRRS